LLVALFVLQTFVSVEANETEHIYHVSLVQLIADPDRYDGKLVNVIGFLRLEFEGNILYLGEADYSNSIPENGIWINVTKQMIADKEDLNNRYVQILGTFSASKGGNALGSGSIQVIRKATFWSDPSNPRVNRRIPKKN
jgi:hypothetical protein